MTRGPDPEKDRNEAQDIALSVSIGLAHITRALASDGLNDEHERLLARAQQELSKAEGLAFVELERREAALKARNTQ